ncbi:MAG: DUF2971 domain-containing protein [Candidatus Margulisbacteria bacterium]|nr:DUF2971 domain-containing protein [Candidatus Margulisiibacteriota bacterium]
MSKKINKSPKAQIGESKIFYKYQKIDENKYPLKNLKNNELCFSSPTEFNDPYDCLSNVFYEGTENELLDFLQQYGSTLSIEELNLQKYKTESNTYLINPGIFYPNNNHSLPIDFRKRLKVCCFSEEDNNFLLWSHYADYNKGICFGFEGKYLGYNGKIYGLAHDRKCYSFDLESKTNFKPIFYQMKYQRNFPKRVNMLTTKNWTPLIDFLLTKHLDWRSEKEYRVFDGINDEGPYIFYKFKKETLKKVILGIYTPTWVVKEVIDILKKEYLQKGYKVELYKMKPVDGKYSMVPEKINFIEMYKKSLE